MRSIMVKGALWFGVAVTLGVVVFSRKLAHTQVSTTTRTGPAESLQSNASQGGAPAPTAAASGELVSRLESSFRDVYLQLLTIIQGFAFGFLATTTLTAGAKDLTLSKWLALATCLFLILVIWQDYMVGATAFAWIPTLLDTIIPYSLGLAQFAVITFAVSSMRNFLLVLAATYVLGVIAWGNFCFHARRGLSINVTSYALLGRYGWVGFYACIVGVVVVSGLLILSIVNDSGRLDPLLAACALATIVPMFFRSIWQWNLRLRGAVSE